MPRVLGGVVIGVHQSLEVIQEPVVFTGLAGKVPAFLKVGGEIFTDEGSDIGQRSRGA